MRISKRFIWIILIFAALISAYYNNQTDALTSVKTEDSLISNVTATTDPIRSLQRSINPITQAEKEQKEETIEDEPLIQEEQEYPVAVDTEQPKRTNSTNRAGGILEIPLEASLEVDISALDVSDISQEIEGEVEADQASGDVVVVLDEIAIPVEIVDEPEEEAIQNIPQEVSLDDRIAYWCSEFTCEQSTLSGIMACSSEGNPDAVSEDGELKGLFQLSNDTFDFYAEQAGVVSGIIWNTEDQIRTAAYMLAEGKLSFFVCGV